MTRARRLALTLTFALVALVAAAPAQATLLVKSDSTGLLVQDKNGLGDRVVISSGTQGGNPVYVVINNNAFDVFKFDRQAGCSAGSSDDRVVCQKASTKLNLAMVGGDDVVNATGSGASTASVNLGSGNDEYDGIGGADDVFAASGDDDVSTGAGNDDIRPGTDSGGNDIVFAGSGNDDITETASGSEGTLLVQGQEGSDEIRILTGANKDMDVVGGSGNDTVVTGAAADKVVGGTGVDNISTSGGADEIVSKELTTSEEDTVNCGFGQDGVIADLKDQVSAVSDPGGGTCEEVDRSPVGETPHVKLPAGRLAVSPTGMTRVRLRCPRGVRRLGCRGSLRLALARPSRRGGRASRSRRVRYRIRAGRSKTVALKLSSADVRALRRSRRRGALVSVEAGRLGPKTTVRNPRLLLRRR